MEQNKPLKIAHPGILPIHCPYLNLTIPGLIISSPRELEERETRTCSCESTLNTRIFPVHPEADA